MADDQTSKNGVFIDTKTGEVVDSQPEEGIQIVPPGGVIDGNAQAAIDKAKADAAGTADSGDKTVTTEKTSGRTAK